jgi:hypothetical protein
MSGGRLPLIRLFVYFVRYLMILAVKKAVVREG